MKSSIILAIGIGMALSTVGPAQAKDPPGVNSTHFQCYRVSQQKPLKPTQVKLADQFGKWAPKLGNALFLCNPVEKNGEPMKDKVTHLTCYQLPAKNAGKKVLVTHQLGEQVLKVGGTMILCLPSLKKVL